MGFGGFVDPKEAAAAREAAEQMEAQRAIDDQRTEALATAIIQGFALLADAVRHAAGVVGPPWMTGPTGPESAPISDAPDVDGSEPQQGSAVYVDHVESVHVRDDIDDLLDGTETEHEQQ